MYIKDMTIDQIKSLNKSELMWLAYENNLRMDCKDDGAKSCYKCTLERVLELHENQTKN